MLTCNVSRNVFFAGVGRNKSGSLDWVFRCAGDVNSLAENCSVIWEYWATARTSACYWTCKYFSLSVMVCLVDLFFFQYFSVECCQGQAFGDEVTGDDLFESRLESFMVIMQDYWESFRRSSAVRRYQGFFLCGQMLNFLHCLLRRSVTRKCLPEEDNWDALWNLTSLIFI